MADIETATTDELVDELAKRMPHGLVVVGRHVAAKGDHIITQRMSRGTDPVVHVGMAAYAYAMARAEMLMCSNARKSGMFEEGDDD